MSELALKANATKIDKLALTVYHTTIFMVGCPGNLIVLLAFGLSKNFRKKPSNLCLLLMTIGDSLTTLFAPPYYAIGLVTKHFDRSNPEFYLGLCKGTIFVLTVSGIVRIFSFTFMSVERFTAIVYPYFYMQHCTRKKVLVVSSTICVHAILSTLPAVLVEGWLEYYASNESICKFTSKPASIVYTAPMVLFNFAIPTIAVILMNMRVFWVARGKLQKVIKDKKQYCQLCIQGNEVSALEARSVCPIAPPEQVIAITVDRGHNVWNGKRTFLDRIDETNVATRDGPERIINVSNILKQKNEVTTMVAENTIAPESFGGHAERQTSQHRCSTNSQQEGQYQSLAWVRRKSSSLFKHFHQSKCKHGYSNRSVAEIKILMSTLVLAFAFTLTWTPYVLTRLIITVSKETNSLRLQMFASAGTVLNCGLNPIIILLTRKEVRDILRRKFFRRKVNVVSNVE